MLQPYRPQPVDGVGCGDPVVGEVFRIAIRGDDFLPGVECLVHAGQEVALEQIVRVKDNVGLERVRAVVALNLPEQKLQRVALGAPFGVGAFVADRTMLPRDAGGVVRAVVRNDKHRDQLGGIVLPPDALQQIPDDRRLIPRCHDNGQLMLPPRRRKPPRCEQPEQRIKRPMHTKRRQ